MKTPRIHRRVVRFRQPSAVDCNTPPLEDVLAELRRLRAAINVYRALVEQLLNQKAG